MIHHTVFPATRAAPTWVGTLVGVFQNHEEEISSYRTDKRLTSEEVLTLLSSDLTAIGFRIERLKHADAPGSGAAAAGDIVHFDVYQPEWMCCLAIEDGHDWANITAAEDLVEPLMVSHVDTLCIAVPAAEERIGNSTRAGEYERTCTLAETVYGHTRVQLPQCLLVIGY